ncbi:MULTISPECIES: dihydroneopterin aldolase [Campylobacter]|uniref:Dihydroneopterin aldolase n=1 Tax=Campylobacter porcelli TaxID=1660073 RepID=A0A1X9SY99_9BACT|nr:MULTISPECIES: dihydroneopterin aldolase [unclassified Campylobacter]MCR8696017.1 dihydroneopterin aldolase [Campylobacter sp. RM19073]MEE3704728.1 dihydroneopterin aldolase [Campylobacter sp. CX2-8023-23]MEE3744701.1 dihydroneopterin aldolase [Campylobacter sp. CX2-4855-23]MEE3776426.1 dihydroneopterin aldolase [Campylobacter sp. CX2-4080-23]ARR01195.1 dihydroneopterin aldolase [Campylobacter sp. RM6137]
MISVFVDELEFDTIIGLLDFERVSLQKICVSMEFQASEFVDYAVVCKITQEEFNHQKFYKVEDALEYFSTKFKDLYPTLKKFYMKISKINIISNAVVGAKIVKNY